MKPELETNSASIPVVIGALALLLAMGVLVCLAMNRGEPAPVNAGRVAERLKALEELRAESSDQLEKPAWVNPTLGVVRIPIEQAMDLVVREWQNPVSGRSNLLTRLEKATQKPINPSDFE